MSYADMAKKCVCFYLNSQMFLWNAILKTFDVLYHFLGLKRNWIVEIKWKMRTYLNHVQSSCSCKL